MNKIILEGNLGSAPQFKKTQTGEDMASFSLATSFSWKDESGEWNKHVDWHQVRVFKESTIRWMKDVLRKGDAVRVEGRLIYRQWKNKLGQSRIEAQVAVSDREGCVEVLRSPHAPGVLANDFSEISNTNAPAIPSTETLSQRDDSVEFPADSLNENSLNEDSLNGNSLNEDSLNGNSLNETFIQPNQPEKEKI